MNQTKLSGRAAWFAVVLAAAGLAPVTVNAADRDVADGDSGVLYAEGELVQSACNIDTASRWQTLAMGDISTGALAWPGARAAGRAFHLRLRDCISSDTTELIRQTGQLVRVTNQPEVRISFISETDTNDPQLIAVEGAEGFGLRLEDSAHHLVFPGRRGEPLVLQGRNDDLTFWLVPERTRAALHEGAWRSVVNMRFSYE